MAAVSKGCLFSFYVCADQDAVKVPTLAYNMIYSSELLAAINSDCPNAFRQFAEWLQQHGGDKFNYSEVDIVAYKLVFEGCELDLIQKFFDSVHLRPWIKRAGNKYGFTFQEYNPTMTYPYDSPSEANKFGIRTAFTKLQNRYS